MSTLLAIDPKPLQTSKPEGLRNLDLLRAIAVLFVFFDHLAKVFTSSETHRQIEDRIGRFGVLLFFVHTSLVLMLSIERSPTSATKFWLRRAFRIYPLSVLFVFAVVLFHIPPLPPGKFVQPSALKMAANLALVQNVFYQLAAGTNTSLISSLWSLPFEIQMYLFLPAIAWFLRKHGGKGVWFLIEASIALAFLDIFTFRNHVWVAEFFPCFMGGVLAFTLMQRQPRLPYFLLPVSLCLMAAAAVSLSLVAPVEWAACLVIGASIPFFRELPDGFFSRGSFLIAKYSFGIYLSQLPLLWLCFGSLHISLVMSCLLFCVLATALPWLLYHLIEAPAIQLGRRLTD